VNNRVPSTFGGQKSNVFTSIMEMILYLKEHYMDRNEVNNTFSQLQKLTQGPNEHFNTFYVKYQKYAVYVQIHEQVKVQQLTAKLNQRYTEKIIGNEYNTVNDLVRRCQLLETQFTDTDARFNTASSGGKGFGRGNVSRNSDTIHHASFSSNPANTDIYSG
jgi:hypothetical protein